MPNFFRRRFLYIALALATIAIGLAVHWHGSAFSPAFRDILGDALWAAMVLWWISAAFPRTPLFKRGAGALAFAYLIEVSQLIHTPLLDSIRGTTLGQLVLGSGFDVRDLVSYTLGVIAAYIFERLCLKPPREQSQR